MKFSKASPMALGWLPSERIKQWSAILTTVSILHQHEDVPPSIALVTGSRSLPFNSEPTPTKWIFELIEPTKELVPNLLRLLEDINFEIRVPTTWTIDAAKNVEVLEIENGVSMEFFLEPTNGELGIMRASHNVPHLPLKPSEVLELDPKDPVTLKQQDGSVFSIQRSKSVKFNGKKCGFFKEL
ncbi:hypothetical protein KQX54_003934 [Cotesia glomerata]|uniref:Uncharacterized protein n=1 Tax=Cotesia glomerata TaxID=32391 RepID=A0AAV7ISI4_COTGL|nr:hypothetical protein KQX54_003934 [Cotesia glomerata]